MAIYKSSFNKKPEKKPKKEKPVRESPVPAKEKSAVKVKSTVKVNVPLICLIVFSILFLVCILPSNFAKNFLLGVFGLLVYPVSIMGILFSVFTLKKRQLTVRKKYVVYLAISLFIIWFILHLILCSRIPYDGYGSFLLATYRAKTTAGGLVFSLISYPLVKLLTTVGAYIFSAILLAVFVGLIVDYICVEKKIEKPEKKSKFDFSNIEDFEIQRKVEPVSEEERVKKIAKQKLGLEKSESTIISSSMPNRDINTRRVESRPMSKRDYILTPLEPVIPPENTDDLFLDNTTGYYNSKKVARQQEMNLDSQSTETSRVDSHTVNESRLEPITPVQSYASKPSEPTQPTEPSKVDRYAQNSEKRALYPQTSTTEPAQTQDIKADNAVEITDDFLDQRTIETDEYPHDSFEIHDQAYDEDDSIDIDDIISDESDDYTSLNAEDVGYGTDSESLDDNDYSDDYSDLENLDEDYTGDSDHVEEISPNIAKSEYIDEYETKAEKELGSTVESEVVRPSVDLSKFHLPGIKKDVVPVQQVKIEDIKPKEEIPPYVAPPVDLLNYIDNPSRITDEELQDNIDRLEQVLEDFKVPAKVNNVQVGPAVTRYELTMPRGISVNKIALMADDIAMTLASNGAIRVEAPIPGKNSVGVEVPNDHVSAVSLRELIDSEEFRVRGNPLSFVLGKDINGDIIFCNLDKMPHMLVAGSTGSGKSVCLNTMLLSMCYKSGPQDLRLILVDPKMVEFSTYNGLPHLLIPEVITNKEMTINALDWAIKEMERRYALFAKNRVVNINEFNKLEKVKSKQEDKLPFIVIVVDELADLMLEAKREIEDRIAKLAAKARAAGIHLVLATQRPSVDVITGTVKANLPSRIAFALTNYMDSKTVLDGGGAEKLLGKGDMLFKPQDKPEPRRVQGAFVSNEEISRVVEFIKDNNRPVYDDATSKAIKNPYQEKAQTHEGGMEREFEFDPILKDALRMFIETKQASSSMISRRYSVGFNRAGRIIDQMYQAGFIGPPEGSKPRQVLISMDEYNAIFGEDGQN